MNIRTLTCLVSLSFLSSACGDDSTSGKEVDTALPGTTAEPTPGTSSDGLPALTVGQTSATTDASATGSTSAQTGSSTSALPDTDGTSSGSDSGSGTATGGITMMDCTSATVVDLGVHTGVIDTDSLDQFAPPCAMGGIDTTDSDDDGGFAEVPGKLGPLPPPDTLGGLGNGAYEALFQFTAPEAGRYFFYVNYPPEVGDIDAVLGVYSGACNGEALACNDDTCGLQPEVARELSPGETVFLVVERFSGDLGTFELFISTTAPSCESLPPDTTSDGGFVGDG